MFVTSNVNRQGKIASHIKDVLHNTKLMAPNSEFQSSAPCEYFDNNLSLESGFNCFTWRVAHCKKPVLSAIEILDMNQFVVATAHSISNSTIPLKRQVDHPLNVPTHSIKTERSFLIRGVSGDFAILKAMWNSYVKDERIVKEEIDQLELKLFKLGKNSFQWINIFTNQKDSLHYQWELDECKVYVDLEKSSIRISKQTKHLPENICIATAITMAFVLCQPRPPPAKIPAYPATLKGRVLNLDSMLFLVASGLYSSILPRWYHETCDDGYFFQIHPSVYNKKRNRQDPFDSFEVEFDSCELETDFNVIVRGSAFVNEKGQKGAVNFGDYNRSGEGSPGIGDHSGTGVGSDGKGSSSKSEGVLSWRVDKTRLKENLGEVSGNGDKSANKGGLRLSSDDVRNGENSSDSGRFGRDVKLSGGGNSDKDGKNLSDTGSYTGSKVTLGVYVSSSGENSRSGGGSSSTSCYREDNSHSSGGSGISSSYGGGGSSSYGGGGSSSYGGGSSGGGGYGNDDY